MDLSLDSDSVLNKMAQIEMQVKMRIQIVQIQILFPIGHHQGCLLYQQYIVFSLSFEMTLPRELFIINHPIEENKMKLYLFPLMISSGLGIQDFNRHSTHAIGIFPILTLNTDIQLKAYIPNTLSEYYEALFIINPFTAEVEKATLHKSP